MDELTQLGSREFVLPDSDCAYTIFVIRKHNTIHVYRNSCPHTLGPLDWGNGVFLDIDRLYIQCAHHGALFEIDSGYCVYGPCSGSSLTSVPHRIVDGWIYIES